MSSRSRIFRMRFAIASLLLLLTGCQTPVTDIEIVPLDEGVWLHTSYYTYPSGSRFPSNGLIVRTGDSLLLIDTAWGELNTVQLLGAIDAQLGLPVSHAVITHSHGDRIGGTDVLEAQGVTVYAHPVTRRLALEYGMPVPDEILTGLTKPGSTAKIQGLEFFYPGPGHTVDNLVAWLPEQRILFGGCAVRALAASSAGNLAHADLTNWSKIIDDLATRYTDALTVVPGHGQVGDQRLLAHTARLIEAAQTVEHDN
ncbi:MAG: subclass B1 metallo-beta-lactamase [Gammaproteobacteria bacterium]|nr:subclass B1 metallo-beta-lactamase [Gammaproteobacteria bacterium]